MAKQKTILPKPQISKVNPQFNVSRARIVVAKRLGNYSWTDLALYYQVSINQVRRWVDTYKRYVSAGLLELPEPIYKEPLK